MDEDTPVPLHTLGMTSSFNTHATFPAFCLWEYFTPGVPGNRLCGKDWMREEGRERRGEGEGESGRRERDGSEGEGREGKGEGKEKSRERVGDWRNGGQRERE